MKKDKKRRISPPKENLKHKQIMEDYWAIKYEYDFTDVRIWSDFLSKKYFISLRTFKGIKNKSHEKKDK